MRAAGHGRILVSTSSAGLHGLHGLSAYAASKAAIVSLTQVLAREFSDFNITVNALGPTPVYTDLIRNVPEEKMERLLRMQTIPRFGTFEDISNVLDFFLQDGSHFVTGQVIYLGGVS